MAVIRKFFSSFSFSVPLMDPIAQHKLLMLSKDHSLPSNCFSSFAVRIDLVFSQSKIVRLIISSRSISYKAKFSLSLIISLVGCPFSSITIKTCKIYFSFFKKTRENQKLDMYKGWFFNINYFL